VGLAPNSHLRIKLLFLSGEKIMPTLYVEDKYCKGCGICVEFCPTKILRTSKKMNSRGYFPPESQNMEKCKKCHLCSLLCPDFAIVVSD
jgi:2-oxoglutarate ferredoxin oxidoreductase subunit delta